MQGKVKGIVKIESPGTKINVLAVIIKLIIILTIGWGTSMMILGFSGITSLILSEKLIEFLLVVSITGAGFGLVGLQIEEKDKYQREIKKELFDISILMIFCLLSGISFLAFPNYLMGDFNFGHFSIFFFIWGIILFLVTLIFVRFNLYNSVVDLLYPEIKR